MNDVGAKLTIRGLVQGVGYRYFFYQRARNLDVTGWVRNNPDGTVAAQVEGDRSVVEELIKEAKAGPLNAHVTDIEINWTEFTGRFHAFEITR